MRSLNNLKVREDTKKIDRIPLSYLKNGINIFENYFIKYKNKKIIWIVDRICDHNYGKLIINAKLDSNLAVCPMHNWKLSLKNLNYTNVKIKKKTLNFAIKNGIILIKQSNKFITYPNQLEKKEKKNLDIRYLSHASVLITFGKIKLLTDPWFFGPAFSNGWWLSEPPKFDFKEVTKNLSYVYISHNHPDHLHIETLSKLSRNVNLITPKFQSNSTLTLLSRLGFKNIKLCEFNKIYEIKDNFKFSILKSGDFKDDSGIFLNINKKKILLNVDSNNLNSGILPKNIDLLMSSYAGGASGFPLCFENYSDDEKERILIRNKNAQFAMVKNLIEKTKCKIFVPYAGFFSEFAARDKYIFKKNKKNSIDRIQTIFKNKSLKIVDHKIIDTIRFNGKNEYYLKKNIDKPLYKMNQNYIKKYINNLKKDYKLDKTTNQKVKDYFKNSNFSANIILYITITKDNFIPKKKMGFLVNFNNKITIKNENYNSLLRHFNLPENKKLRKIFIKVREESFCNTIINNLPWEDLLIGFQCKIIRKPNIYNNDFWYHFSNIYIDKVNFRYKSPCNQCETILQQIY